MLRSSKLAIFVPLLMMTDIQIVALPLAHARGVINIVVELIIIVMLQIILRERFI